MEAVQFIGKEDILKAFDNVKVCNWAIFHGKRLLEKYEGDAEVPANFGDSYEALSSYLDLMARSRTLTVYRLCTYEDWTQGDRIKPSTECDRSFNFQITHRYSDTSNGSFTPLDERLKAIDAKLALLEDREEDPEPQRELGAIGLLNKALDIPMVQQKIAAVIGALLDKIIPTDMFQQKQQPTPAAVGSVSQDEEVQKINQALYILSQVDQNLGDNLLKVADLAQRDPKKYLSLIKML